MKKNLKRNIGNLAINLGKHAVGKCMIPGMFDPRIPDEIKEEGKIEYLRNIRVSCRKYNET